MKSLTSIILILLSVLAYFMYIAPTYSTVQMLSTENTQYTNVLEKAKEIASRRDTVLSSYNALSPDDVTKLDTIIPETFNSVLLAKHINTIASNYGMAVQNIQIVQPTSDNRDQVIAAQASQYQTIPVSFSLTGQYSQLMSFLKDLESGLYLVDVTNISIKSNSQKGTISLYDMSITLNTYSLH